DFKDEFEGRRTTLGVTLITGIEGPWRATSPTYRNFCRVLYKVEDITTFLVQYVKYGMIGKLTAADKLCSGARDFLSEKRIEFGKYEAKEGAEWVLMSLVCGIHEDLEEYMDDGDSRVAKESKLFYALEHKSVVIEVDNQKIAIFTKAPLWAFGEPYNEDTLMPCKVERASILGRLRRKMVEMTQRWKFHGIKFQGDFVVFVDYVNEVNLTILFGEGDFLATTKKPIDFVLWRDKDESNNGSKRSKRKSKPDSLKCWRIYVLTDENEINFDSLYKDLGLGDPRPYQMNLTIADNTQAKAMGEVKNVMIQIGYQAYVVDLLILDIPVDPKLPLLLGRPFLRTCRAIIDMGRGEDDWLGSFEVGRDEDRNMKYGPVVPSFIDIKDYMERALAMEAYFNPFKNITIEGINTYSLQLVSNANLKWRDLPSVKRHAYCEKLSKLQEMSFGVPRVAKMLFIDVDGFDDTLREIKNWKDEVKHHLFEVYFGRLEVDDKQFDHKDYWTRVGKPTLTNYKEVLVKEPLMRIMHKVIVGSLGLGGDDYFTSTMPDFGGSSSGYAVGGSSRGDGFNDDDDIDE
ncbi:hypothetical protein Tco_0509111, partial [Tanacetum coccineum]